MAVNPSPFGPKPQWELSDGTPAVGYKLFWYVSGSVNTKQNTYTDSTGGVANANPIILNALGQPSTEIWLTAGSTYKAVLAPSTDTDPPTSPVWTISGLRGINDASLTIDQWVSSGLTPTYVSGTQFTLAGDQTTDFHVGRRLKFTVTAGTVYGRITASAYAAVTTVTMLMDGTQALDNGLSAVLLSILTNDVIAVPFRIATAAGTDTYTATVGALRYVSGDEYRIKITNANTSSAPTLNLDGLGAKTIKTQSGAVLSAAQLSGEHTFRYNGTDMIVLNPITIVVTPLPRSYLAGFGMANNAVDATNDIDIAAGSCRDSTNAANITGAAMTKQLDANWAAGTGAGMRNSAVAIANTTYHIYAVSKADGTQDYYAHTSVTVATVIAALQAEPSGSLYLYARRIGSIVRSGATILAFLQAGEWFDWASPPLDVNDGAPGTAAVTRTLTVPTGINVVARINHSSNSGGTMAYVSALDTTDLAPAASASPLASVLQGPGMAMVRTNTSAQIRSRSSSNVAYVLATVGWIDRRGRDD